MLLSTRQLLCIFAFFKASKYVSALAQSQSDQSKRKAIASRKEFLMRSVESVAMISLMSSAVLFVPRAFADEIGRETEAPTLATGETVMICTKRGPLGACTKTEERTKENDNDRASKYFRDPNDRMKKEAIIMAEEAEGNALIKQLRQQSVDNKEKNDLLVLQKTMLNDQSASFGPFDRNVVILNTDGRTFTLLENPQAMRLKKAGFIEDRKFVKQPTAQEIEDALPPPDDGGISDFFKGIFGGSN
mmetsp:Transcript_17777/g.20474  ORF Transcript_17777/g.20474 Transcript_17777/m.20474 type:complete len:246 (-) Transcript_17777:53-790(-)